MKNLLIVIEGPTASGKTALGVALAKQYNSVVLSADSRQFYRELAIGTAKPLPEEQDGVAHYFVDSHSILDPVTSAQYEQEALTVLDQVFQTHPIVFLVGGSGMFIDALCHGLDPIPHDDKLRSEITELYQTQGIEVLQEEVKRLDPEYYAQMDVQNPVRLIRALEVIRLTGSTFSSQREKKQAPRSFDFQKFVIDLPREVLYERINRRVDIMMEQGLYDEVKAVYDLKHLQSLNTVGYSELFSEMDGTISLPDAIALIKQNTRRYAKRQLTWFRKDPSAIWLSTQERSEQIAQIQSFIEQQ